MSEDPMGTFGGLLASCISEVREDSERRAALESAALLLLGMACSLVTTYALAALGILV